MAEDQVYEACLEIRPDGACVAQLCDLPACFARGPDETQTLAALESSIPAYFAWLSRHDDYTPVMRGPFRVVAAETLRKPDALTGIFFQADAAPLTVDDLDWYATLLGWSYQDYEAQIDVSTVAASNLCETQAWLLSRIEVNGVSTMTVAHAVGLVHQAALARVRSASAEDRSRIHDLDGERWSLRKVLRRSILLVREAASELG